MKTGTGFVFQNITAERNEELLKMCIQMAAALKAQEMLRLPRCWPMKTAMF